MVTNNKEYQREYMKKLIAKKETKLCDVCKKYVKNYRMYRHNKSKKHLLKVEALKNDASKEIQPIEIERDILIENEPKPINNENLNIINNILNELEKLKQKIN